MTNRTGTVALVGAGCGGREWLTIKGLELIRNCDAVVYDDLIDAAILAEAPETARRIAMGKRCGKESAAQGDIESTLVALAKEGLRVVRLKGGDPFIFGRGGEELIALNAAGIPWTVVPGITSSIAVPMEAGIPVTHRGIARSVTIITGHTKEDHGPENIETLAKMTGTLVFLMGLGALEGIARDLVKYGKRGDTPAAVISGGNSKNPARVIATLDTICEAVKAAGVVSPAIILVGDVAALGLLENAKLPLAGVTIGMTGTDAFKERLKSAFDFTGARCRSMMDAEVVSTGAVIDWKAIAEREGAWLVFTSGQGVEMFFRRARREAIDLRSLAKVRFAVIGEATARALREHGFTADLMPEEATSKHLAEAMRIAVKPGETVFTLVSRKGSETVEKTLCANGIEVIRTDIYDVEYRCATDIAAPDVIVFGSAGGVKALHSSGYAIDAKTKSVCIGPVCADALRETYGINGILADAISVEGIVKKVSEIL